MSILKTAIRSTNQKSISSCVLSKKILHLELETLKSLSCITSTHKLFYSTRSQSFNDSPKFKAFKAKQAKMQCDDGYPVYLKGGLIDKILYHITVGACVIGLVQGICLIYDLAKK